MKHKKLNYEQDVTLAKAITLPHLVLYGTGSMIGAGIYVLIGVIADHAQFYTPLAFLLAGVIGLLTALSYATLSSHFPHSAGAALYIHRAFKHDYLSQVVGYLVILTGVISSAALAKGFSGYALELINISYNALTFAIIVILGAIAIYGIHMSIWVISIISLIEIFGLVFISFLFFPQFEVKNIVEKSFSVPDSAEWIGILNAVILAFYAFIGFEDMVNVVEEVHDNKKAMYKGVIYAFLTVTVIYFIFSIITIGAIKIETFATAKAPLAQALEQQYPWGKLIITLISLVATTNGILIQIIMASRIFYGMAKQKISLPLFSYIFPLTQTPIYAILVTLIIIIGFAYWLPIEPLAKLTSFIVLLVFSLVNLALIRLATQSSVLRKRTSLWLPLIALMSCVALFSSQLYIELFRK